MRESYRSSRYIRWLAVALFLGAVVLAGVSFGTAGVFSGSWTVPREKVDQQGPGWEELAWAALLEGVKKNAKHVDCADKVLVKNRCSSFERCKRTKKQFKNPNAQYLPHWLEDSRLQCRCFKAFHRGNWSKFVDALYAEACSLPPHRRLGVPRGCLDPSRIAKLKSCR